METLQSRLDFITNSTTAERLNITYVLMDRAMHCPLNNPLRTFPKELMSTFNPTSSEYFFLVKARIDKF